MEALRNKRKAQKTKELEDRATINLTQEAAAAVSKHNNTLQKQHKEVMAAKHQATLTQSAGKNKKENDAKRKQVPAEAITTQVKASKSKTKTKTITTRVIVASPLPPVQQGTRKVPKLSDLYGCKHNGLRDFICLDRVHLVSFVKEEAWLCKKPCTDCAQMNNKDPHYDVRVLEMKQLLTKGSKEFGFYCNCGPTAHKMKNENENKPFYSCDVVLCPYCYAQRETKRCSNDNGRRTRCRAAK